MLSTATLTLFCFLLFQSILVVGISNDTVQSRKLKHESESDDLVEKKATNLSFYYCVSNYLGDLGGNEGVGKKFIHDANYKKQTSFFGFSVSHIRKEAVGLRLSYVEGKIAGGDQDVSYKNQSDYAFYRYKRNLDFQSRIKEWSILAEVYPFKFIRQNSKLHQLDIQPYLLWGFGRYSFNPQGSYFDEIAADYIFIDLQPLRTEGQGMTEYPNRKYYKLKQTNMPYGFGVQYKVGRKTNLGFEFVGRKLFTDYLDDVSTSYIDPTLFAKYLSEEDADIARSIHNKSNSIDPNNPYVAGDQRGNPKKYDFYYSFNLKLSIQISRSHKKTTNIVAPPSKEKPKWQHYKYDNTEMCE